VEREADLLQVVLAGCPLGGFAHFLHGRQQQGDQNGDDGHDDEQFNKRECGARMT
jgi:hypothetical protein